VTGRPVPAAEATLAVSEARLQTLGAVVAAATGAHLFVTAADHGSPRMDWHTVTIPSDTLAEGEDAVLGMLLHEWGHRLVSPGSLERAVALVADLRSHLPLSHSAASDVVNVACDLWVDDHFLRDRRFSRFFLEDVQRQLLWLDEQPRGNVPKAARACVELVEMMAHVAAERARQAGLGTLVAEPCPLAREVLAALFEETVPEAERIRTLAEHIGNRVKAVEGMEQELLRASTLRALLTAHDLLERVNLPKLAQELGELGLEWSELGRLLPGSDRHRRRLAARVRRLGLYPRLMRNLRRALDGGHELQREGWRTWSVGSPPSRLDLPATVQRCALVIPGVTTLERARAPTLRTAGRRAGSHLCLVVDDSGSTEGPVNDCEVEAALGLVEGARHFRDLTSVVAFGSEVSLEVRPTADYEMVAEQVAMLTGSSGGTCLAPALEAAAGLIASTTAAATHLVVLTDAELYDLEAVLHLLAGNLAPVRTTFFCFSEPHHLEPFLEAVQGLPQVAVFVSPDGDGFEESSLVEHLTWRVTK